MNINYVLFRIKRFEILVADRMLQQWFYVSAKSRDLIDRLEQLMLSFRKWNTDLNVANTVWN